MNRGGGRGGPPRKNSTPVSQDAAVPAPKLVVDPPTATNTPAERPKPKSRPKPTRRHSATALEDSTSVSSQPSARPLNRQKRFQQGRPSTVLSNAPSNLLSVQTLSRKASTGPSSPNPTKDVPPHLSTAPSTATPTELKNDIDALVERVRAVAMDRPHTPGSHIDWADDDDSLPTLNEWGYTENAVASTQPEEPPTSTPSIPEEAPPQSVVPEVKVEGEPSPDETKSQDAKPGPHSDAAPRTHKVQKTRSRGARSGGNPRTHKLPPALNLTDSVSQDSPLSPIQPAAAATTTKPTTKPQAPKRQNSRNNQGQTNSKGNGGGNGGGRQRGQNGAIMASPMRNSFPTKPGPKANHTPPVQPQTPAQGQPPDVVHPATNPSTDLKPLEPKGETVPGDERKKGVPAETPRTTDTNDPNPHPTAPLREIEPTDNNPQPNTPQNQTNKRNSYNPSHTRAHTYGGRTQGGLQPLHSPPTLSLPQPSSDTNPNPQNPRPPRSPNLRPPGLGPKSTGFERHNRNHSSPSGVGGATRQPHTARPVLTGGALSLLAKTLGNTSSSPKKDPPGPSPAS